MGTNLEPIDLPMKVSIALQTHPWELPSRDFKSLMKMISDYEGEEEMVSLNIEPKMVSVSVQNDFTNGSCSSESKDVAVQTNALKELIVPNTTSASVQTDVDEQFKKLRALNQCLQNAVELVETENAKKSSTVSVKVQTIKKGAKGSLAPKTNGDYNGSNILREIDMFRHEMQHLYNIMKCEQHILDLRFTILEHRHEIVDDRVDGIFKYIPEAMAYINPRAKRLSVFGALKHFIRQAVYGSLLVAILSITTLYTTFINIIKYHYV